MPSKDRNPVTIPDFARWKAECYKIGIVCAKEIFLTQMAEFSADLAGKRGMIIDD